MSPKRKRTSPNQSLEKDPCSNCVDKAYCLWIGCKEQNYRFKRIGEKINGRLFIWSVD